ncbi:MAG TPA: four helix bundle protein, partial [Pirellulales bacterium]|nr:four helix bundle protein [Pirellulales bacterium]
RIISKLEGGLQELDESAYWMELLSESGIVASSRLTELEEEADELTAILTACVKAAKQRKAKPAD